MDKLCLEGLIYMFDKLNDEKIVEWIELNKDEILKKWIELAKIPSITGEPKPEAPFGENCAKALNFSGELFKEAGFNCDIFSDGGYALAKYGEGGKAIGLFCHSDVVPVGDDWLYTKPFEPIIKNGALIGRGVEDNKSGIIATLCLYKFLNDNGIKLRNHLVTFIGSDEECGMKDLDNYLEKHEIPDFSIVPDADFPCSVGEKGIYHFMAESNEKFENVIDFFGGEAFNIVLDNVTAVIKYSAELECEIAQKIAGRSDFTLKSENGTLVLKAKGVAKHASIPEGSMNAAFLASELLSECENLSENDKNIFGKIKDILSSYYGEGIGVVHTDENFGQMTSVNGLCKTVEGRPCVSFDVRYGSTLDPEFLEKTSEITLNKKGFTVTCKNNSPGFAIEKDSKFPEIFEFIYEKVTGVRKERVLMSGGTYARRLKNAFSIGTYAYTKGRKEPVLQMPDGHGGAHQCDEMIDIEGFFTAFRILVHSVLACDEIL